MEFLPASAEGTVPTWYSEIQAAASDQDSKRPIDPREVKTRAGFERGGSEGEIKHQIMLYLT